jgi:hypothetical protein
MSLPPKTYVVGKKEKSIPFLPEAQNNQLDHYDKKRLRPFSDRHSDMF